MPSNTPLMNTTKADIPKAIQRVIPSPPRNLFISLSVSLSILITF